MRPQQVERCQDRAAGIDRSEKRCSPTCGRHPATAWPHPRCACCGRAGSIGRFSKLTMLVELCAEEAAYPPFGAWSPALKEAQVGRQQLHQG